MKKKRRRRESLINRRKEAGKNMMWKVKDPE